MAKLKTAILRAQETAGFIGSNESLLWQARAALSDAINNPEPEEGLASADTTAQYDPTIPLLEEITE